MSCQDRSARGSFLQDAEHLPPTHSALLNRRKRSGSDDIIVFANLDSPRIEDGRQRPLCRVLARSARATRSHRHAAHVRQDRVDDDNRTAFKETESFPPLDYQKKGGTIDLSFWRAPERLFDEPDELVIWARAALAAARRVAAKRERTARKRKSKSQL
jgi:TfoX/Sxy family transcriptional regulator of competence genes